jgi:hypothetical protein
LNLQIVGKKATAVTVEQIDQLLADWKQKIDLASQNLIDLHGLPTYQRLCGVSGFPPVQLTGTTLARVTPALEAMNELFQHFDLLIKTINQATELRKQLSPLWVSEVKVREIEQILTGSSIQLAVVQIPLAQRGLLSMAQTANAIAPLQLLAAMTSAFDLAKNAVLEVDAAWMHLEPALAASEVEIVSLQRLAESLGQGSVGELSAARQKITALRDKIESDPLGVSANFDREIKPLILRVKATVEESVRQQNQMREKFACAHHLLSQLTELNRQTETAFRESEEKIADHLTLQTPLDPAQIEALSQWLTRLETKFKQNLINPIQIGLENWIAKAKIYIAKEERAYAANKAPLELRAELRGRLDALQAKALARGLAENAILSQLAENAKRLLYTRPTPLDKAAELVTQYEQELNRKPYNQQ